MVIEGQKGLGLFSLLKNKRVRLNPTSWRNQIQPFNESIHSTKENTFNPHNEIVRKVDALIALNERENWSEEPEFVTKLKNNYWE